MMPIHWKFITKGAVNNGHTCPLDCWAAYRNSDGRLIGYVEKGEGTVLECTDWCLTWLCDDGACTHGMPIGVEFTIQQVQLAWLGIYFEGLEDARHEREVAHGS